MNRLSLFTLVPDEHGSFLFFLIILVQQATLVFLFLKARRSLLALLACFAALLLLSLRFRPACQSGLEDAQAS